MKICTVAYDDDAVLSEIAARGLPEPVAGQLGGEPEFTFVANVRIVSHQSSTPWTVYCSWRADKSEGNSARRLFAGLKLPELESLYQDICEDVAFVENAIGYEPKESVPRLFDEYDFRDAKAETL